jgi:hypothetical protein
MQRERGLPYGVLLASLAAAVLGLSYAPGLYCSDDTRYLVGIHKLVHGLAIDPASTAERRLLFSLPFAAVLGLTQRLEPLFLLAVLAYVSLVALAYGCARTLLPRTAATAVAFAVALHPLLYVFAGALLPDVASSAAILVSMWALLRWESGGRGSSYLFGAGFASGISVCMKESGLALIPLFAILLSFGEPGSSLGRWLRRAAGRWSRYGLGLLLALGIEAVLFLSFAGRLHSSVASAAIPPDFRTSVAEQGWLPWERLVTLASLLRDFVPWSYAAPLIAFAALAAPSISQEQRRSLVVLLAFALWPLFFFALGTTSIHAYVPPVMQARYFAPVVAPGAIAVAVTVWWLVPERRTRVLILTTFVALLALQGFGSGRGSGGVYASAHKVAWQRAQADLAERYPGLAIVDAPGGHDDLARCRKILREFPDLSDDLVQGRLSYDVGSLRPPFLLLGLRDFMELDHPFVGSVQSELAESRWTARVVGSYPGRPTASSLRSRPAGPRRRAGEAIGGGPELGLEAVLVAEVLGPPSDAREGGAAGR